MATATLFICKLVARDYTTLVWNLDQGIVGFTYLEVMSASTATLTVLNIILILCSKVSSAKGLG